MKQPPSTEQRTRSARPGRAFWLLAWAILVLPAAGRAQDGKKSEPPARPAGAAPAAGPAAGAPAPAGPGASQPAAAAAVVPDDVQLSFGGANVDQVVKWLSEVTGKSIVKHKGVQCQLTIVSSKKLPLKDAIGLVYRALALEGFSAIETEDSIMLLPEAMEAKIGAELVGDSESLTGGRQIQVKVFKLQNTQPSKLRDKIRGVLSEKGKLEVDDQANKIIVTDYADNVKLFAELIRELDVVMVADTVIEIFNLKFAEAEDLSRLVGAIFNEAGRTGASPQPGPQPGAPPQPGAGAPSGGGDSIRFFPDKTTNRLIVTAQRRKMAEIKTLIETLDVEKPPDVGVRVIALHHVSAKDLVQEIGPLYQKVRGTSLKDLIEITANSRSNSLIVLSSESNYKELETLVKALDTKDAQEKETKAFPLQNADAEDVSTQLQDLYRKGEDDGYSYYYYRRYEQSQSGQVRFVADRRRNTVIAIAAPSSMEGIGQMIRVLDEPVAGESLMPKIYPLKFVSALDLEQVLNDLFLKRRQRRGYWDYEFGSEEVDRNVGRLYGKIRIASEPNTNSLIVTANSLESLQAVEEILKKLDTPSEAGDTTLNVGLKYAKAVTLANNLNILFAQGGAPQRGQRPGQEGRGPGNRQPAQQPEGMQGSFELEEEILDDSYFPWLGGQQESMRTFDGRITARPVSDLVGKVRVVPDVRTNSLLITTNAHFFPQVMKVVDQLDVPTAQVLLEAKIVEVSSDLMRRLGTRWSPDGDSVFDAEDLDDSILGTVSTQYREVFAGGAVADALRTGLLDVRINLDIVMQFLRKTADSRVRAEPRINVADNERGKLFVGARVPFILSSQLTAEGTRNDNFRYIDVGIILEVTPHINTNNDVALKIRVESSNIRPGQTILGGAILDTRNYRTDLVVRSGQTLVLGGIIQQEESMVERKVPYLGDIPILGWLFKKKDTTHRDVELMVFLRPTVTQTQEDVDRLMQEEEQKTPQIKQWRDQLRQAANPPPVTDPAKAPAPDPSKK